MTDAPIDTHLDVVLQGGHVIDPATGIDGPMDVGIVGERIVRLDRRIEASDVEQVVDVTGLVVTPGIVDMHTHVYDFPLTQGYYVEGVRSDAHCFASGVTTAVDVGTAGWIHWDHFKRRCIDRSPVRILAFLNIASGGMIDAASEQNPRELDPGIAAALAKRYSELIVGIKSAHYWTRQPWDEGHPPWASVDLAIEAGEASGLPIMFDFWPRPPQRAYPDLLLKKMRPGDIHTHVYAQQFPIVTEEGGIQDWMYQARARGVLFDLGHGAGSFVFRNAVPALANGFPPDSISTDLHMSSINGPVHSMVQTMSKFLSMGMPLAEVIQRSTSNPAQMIGRPELGTLAAGSEADVAVFRVLEGQFGFADCGRAKLIGPAKLECELTLCKGKIVFDPGGLSMPEWTQAPASYWTIPELQPDHF